MENAATYWLRCVSKIASKGSDYMLNCCYLIKIKTGTSWGNIVLSTFSNACSVLCVWVLSTWTHSGLTRASPSYTVYQSVLGCLRLRSRNSSNNTNASTAQTQHTSFVYLWQTVKLEPRWGEEQYTVQSCLVFFLFRITTEMWRKPTAVVLCVSFCKKKSICFVPEHGATCKTKNVKITLEGGKYWNP